MTTISQPICDRCIHKREKGETCDAYPDGIPYEILLSEVDHTKPYKGDHGIQFSPRPARDPVELTPRVVLS